MYLVLLQLDMPCFVDISEASPFLKGHRGDIGEGRGEREMGIEEWERREGKLW